VYYTSAPISTILQKEYGISKQTFVLLTGYEDQIRVLR
jgi:hypothetical protein